MARRIADGVRRAIKNLAPAEIGWAVASEPREVFNRRWFMKPGTVPSMNFCETACGSAAYAVEKVSALKVNLPLRSSWMP